MSNENKAEAKLKGYEGPYFNDPVITGKHRGLSRVQKRLGYHPERFNQMLLDQVAKALPGGYVVMYPKTCDGYRWIGAIRFASDGKRFKVLIPMLHDSDMRDDTYADRHAALYSMAASTEEDRDAAAVLFADAFVSTYREKYRNAIEHSKRENGVAE